MRRLTQDEVCKRLKEKQFTLLGKYKNTRTKVRLRCDICGYEYEVVPNTILNVGCGCPNCSNRLKKTTEKFIEELKVVNPNIEVLGEYVNSNTKIKCKCLIDNNIWYPIPSNLLIGEGCPKCKAINTSKRLRKTHEDFLKELNQINSNIEPLEEYITGKHKIYFHCKICDTKWKTAPQTILNGSICCPACANNMKYTTEQFSNKIKNIVPDISIIGEYINNHTKIKCRCNKCKKIFYKTPSSILLGNGCPICSSHKFRDHEDFVYDMKSVNPKIKILGKFSNTKEKILVECIVCGNKWESTPNMLLQGFGCRKCYMDNNRGENHPNWNPNLSDEDRILGRGYSEYSDWVNKILENDKWTCQITSQIGGNLNVHHLDGYNWCKDKRLDIKNGITLSHEIHNEFHSIYGKGNNTTEQFIDYVNNKHDKNEISDDKYLKLIQRLNENKGEN